MAEKVIEPGTISLNGEYYPLVKGSKVTSTLASLYAPKVTLGDFSPASDPRRSTVTWNDWSGGLGMDRIVAGRDLDRVWTSHSNILYPNLIVLPFDGTLTVTSPTSSAGVTTMNEMAVSGKVFATMQDGVKVEEYNGSSGWIFKDTLPAAATDSQNCYLGNGDDTFTEWLVWATTTGFTYTNGSAFSTDNGKNAKFLTYWDNRLWGIDNEGQLWGWVANESLSSAVDNAINDAVLPAPAGDIQALFTGPDSSGEEIIYASTKVGLFAHDAANSRFLKTALRYARNDNGGKAALTWNGDIYVAVDMAVYRYIPTSGIIQSVGLDQDGGVSSNRRGAHIAQLIGTPTRMFARATQATGVSAIYEYNGRGWSSFRSNQIPMDAMHIGNAHGEFRIWIAQKVSSQPSIVYFPLPTQNIQPEEDATLKYLDDSTVEFPYFTSDHVDLLALRVRVETLNPTPSETVLVEFKTNWGGDYITLGTITAPGFTTYTFPDNGTSPNTGTEFRSIRFKLSLARGGEEANTPVVKSFTLEYRKKLTAKWAATFELNLADSFKGNNAQQLLENLITATESNALVEFTYRDPAKDSNATFNVDVVSLTGIHQTGNRYENDRIRLTVTEV